ncbi:nucleoside triphosphate pyrophosphohydrolase [Bacillus sp. NEB1478]|uniref:nucleoside triphosphate pyrophosphohydrolase n=1 Tax=Bacillus sp. NEB1478 TaxID=3073816 RepID=UPI002873B514|nr:nucleoside triphosphate pyrophosphohydrolase [Bacillus sp. NEB1478]WNB90796.1 nucleoside triphosphate pyrophosphohydrolase [Bacillus sp. NEB1478]
MAYYNKLVRDKIPELLEQAGKKGTFRILGDKEFESELKKKLIEGVKEFRDARREIDAVEELAGLYEMLIELSRLRQLSIREMEEIRKEKVKKHGGYKERLFLVKVED